MDQEGDAVLQVAREDASLDELSDIDVDGDGSSSLSDIEDKEAEQDDDVEDAEGSDDLSNVSEDEENDSEAETERLEDSPNKFRQHQDVVLSSHNGNQTYEPSPSKLHNQILVDNPDEEDEEDLLSDDDVTLNESPESPKSSAHEEQEPDPTTAATSLEDSAGEGKRTLLIIEADTRKRKRSIMAGSGLDEDLDEPMRKRTGSVMTLGDEYAIDDEVHPDEEIDTSNPISGNISGDEVPEDEVPEDVEEPVAAEDEAREAAETPVSPKKRGRKKKKIVENGVSSHDEDPEALADGDAGLNGDDEARNGEEDNVENEGDDEAEAALKNEEERELSFSLWPLDAPVLTSRYSREEEDCT